VRLCREPFERRHEAGAPGPLAVTRDEVHRLSVWSKWLFAGVFRPSIPLFPTRAGLLESAARSAPREGLWLEFGVFRGESINILAPVAPATVYGFDSFEGLPERWMPGMPAGSFSVGGVLPPVRSNVKLVKGWFRDTLPPFLERHPNDPVSLLHVDCDLYRSSRTVLAALAPRLCAGSVIVLDDFEGLFPDTVGRAFRELVRATGRRFEYTGASLFGAVAVRLDGGGENAARSR
jgi:hypothetical protein